MATVHADLGRRLVSEALGPRSLPQRGCWLVPVRFSSRAGAPSVVTAAQPQEEVA
jgi:hypothetical protein